MKKKDFIGIDLGGTKMLVVAEKDGATVAEKYKTGKNITLEQIKSNYQKFLAKHSIIPKALGVAIPGLVNENKVIKCDVLPCLNDIKPSSFSLEYPVSFVNDVEAALLEEKNHYPKVQNMVVVMIGTGIGMSLLINGKVYRGSNGFAGELGYSRVIYKNDSVYLDDIAAGVGILEQFGDDAESFRNKLNHKDLKALNILEQAAQYMGMALSSVILLLNPELIVVGGGASSFPGYFNQMTKAIEQMTLPTLQQSCQIVRESSVGFTVANGALLIAKESISSN